MKNLYQHSRFDFPMTAVKFLCTIIQVLTNIFQNTSYTVTKLRNHQVLGPLVSV